MARVFDFTVNDGCQRKITVRWSNYNVDGFLVSSVHRQTLKTLNLIDCISEDSSHKVDAVKGSDKYRLHIYGLKTVQSTMGSYKQVTCFARFTITAGITSNKLFIDMGKYPEYASPFKMIQEGKLSLQIQRRPPCDYVVKSATSGTDGQYIVLINYNDILIVCDQSSNSLALSLPIDFPPAIWVSCKVYGKRQNSALICSSVVKFETFLTINENNKLYKLALRFKKSRGLRKIKYFYRNKNQQYFDDIMNNEDGVMKPMLKNNGGEQGSVINGNFHGLFFSTYLDIHKNKPQRYSYFGPVRFNVQAEILFTPECNLYFVDFYCHYVKHHIAIIMTPSSSTCNSFCQKYLHQLDIYDNPFLKLQRDGNDRPCTVMVNMDMIIEVYYTETVNIKSIVDQKLGYMEDVVTKGRGYVLPQGIPKRPTCHICNLK